MYIYRVEDIPNYFDMMIVSRFPDSARMNAKTTKLKPWKSSKFSFYFDCYYVMSYLLIYLSLYLSVCI